MTRNEAYKCPRKTVKVAYRLRAVTRERGRGTAGAGPAYCTGGFMTVADRKAQEVVTQLQYRGVDAEMATKVSSFLAILGLILFIVKMVWDCYKGNLAKCERVIRNPGIMARLILRGAVFKHLVGYDLPRDLVLEALLEVGKATTADDIEAIARDAK